MKKLLPLLTILLMISCSKTDKKIEQIEAKVVENALGEDLDYTPVSLEKVADVTYNDILEVFYVHVPIERMPLDKLIERTKEVREEQRQQDNAEVFNLLGYYLERFEQIKNAKDTSAVAYSIYKHKYTIINPLFNDAKVPVTNYYYFDAQDNLIEYFDEDTFKDYKKNFIKHEMMPYEMLLITKD